MKTEKKNFNFNQKITCSLHNFCLQLILDKTVSNDDVWAQYKDSADQFICNVIQKGSSNTKISPGGALWFQPWNNLQYTTAASLLIAAHADHLAAARASLQCPGGVVLPNDLINFVRQQVINLLPYHLLYFNMVIRSAFNSRQADYILGANPKKLSYLVGFGPNYPTQVHHRGASIPSIKNNPTPTDCNGGFKFMNANTPNPNVLHGAIVGGPDDNDGYTDSRSNFQQNEPATINTAPFVGVLARLA